MGCGHTAARAVRPVLTGRCERNFMTRRKIQTTASGGKKKMLRLGRGPMPDADTKAALEGLREEIRRLRQEVRSLAEESYTPEMAAAVRALAGDDPDQLYGYIRAAELVDMTVGALRVAAWRGTIPTVKVNGRIRFRRGDLLQIKART